MKNDIMKNVIEGQIFNNPNLNYSTSHGYWDYFYGAFLLNNLTNKEPLVERNISQYTNIKDEELVSNFMELTNTDIVFESLIGSTRNICFYDEKSNFFAFFYLGSRDSDAKTFKMYYPLNSEYDDKIKGFFKKIKNVKAKYANVHVLAKGSNGLYLQDMGELDYKLEDGNYDNKTVEDYYYVLNELKTANPRGRLTILNGPPGCGKTYLIKSLLSSLKDELVVLLPAKFTGEIDGPDVLSLFLAERNELKNNDGAKQHHPIIFVIEDADTCLVPRGADNISTISTLLNLTDGIFGSMLDVRFVASTNAESINFDSALTRPGRLAKHMFVDLLKPSKAAEIYKRLSGKEKKYDKEVSLATVYQDYNNGKNDYEKNVKKHVVGF